MAKPIIVTKHLRRPIYWTVSTRAPDVLERYGVSREKAHKYGFSEIVKSEKRGSGITLDNEHGAEKRAYRFRTHSDAIHVAHQIGHYMLGLGDLVYAYTDEKMIEGEPGVPVPPSLQATLPERAPPPVGRQEGYDFALMYGSGRIGRRFLTSDEAHRCAEAEARIHRSPVRVVEWDPYLPFTDGVGGWRILFEVNP